MEERPRAGLLGKEVGKISFSLPLCGKVSQDTVLLVMGCHKGGSSIVNAGPASSPGNRSASDWELT